jgi:hypothetical protein
LRRFHAVLATIRVDGLGPGALVCCVERTVRFAGAGHTDSIVYEHFKSEPTRCGNGAALRRRTAIFLNYREPYPPRLAVAKSGAVVRWLNASCDIIIIIISVLMTPLLGHRSSGLHITRWPSADWWVRTTANAARVQWLNVPSEARRSSRQ